MIFFTRVQIYTALFFGGFVLMLTACGDKGTASDTSQPVAVAEKVAPTETVVTETIEPVPVSATLAMAEPKEHIVYAQATSFDPKVLFINPGDTVKFTNMSPIHDSVSIDGLIPEGAEPWKFAIGVNGSVTLNADGIYIYKCTPHYAVGMVAAVVVGEAVNLEEIKVDATGRATVRVQVTPAIRE